MPFDPNPLFYEMCRIYSENYSPDNKVIICNEGGTRCFHPGQLVITNNGSKPISQIIVGEKVKSKSGFKTVLETHNLKNSKKTVRVKLKNGKEIICTEDHEFFFKGSWVSIKHILSLFDGNMEADNKV